MLQNADKIIYEKALLLYRNIVQRIKVVILFRILCLLVTG